MIGPKRCPFCQTPAGRGCVHLALAVEARDFVRGCVEMCQGQQAWISLCRRRRAQPPSAMPQPALDLGFPCSAREDFTWLETAFCDEFLRGLRWFGGTDYEWRSGPKPEQGGFWVLLWSRDPQRLWWELRDEIERQGAAYRRASPRAAPVSAAGTAPFQFTPHQKPLAGARSRS